MKGPQQRPRLGKAPFLVRLSRDQRGNTLAIVAAAMFPLIGMVGSAVDLGRAYLAQTRLQHACDAGVLAGRKVMADSVDAKVTAEVRKFVNFDFPQRTLGTAPFEINPTKGEKESVDLTLATSVPTVLMKLFNFDSFPISVDCTARQDFVNTDIMLVLDTTLSMNCAPSDGKDTYCQTEKSNAKIKALREAVIAFYKSLRQPQTALENAGLRLRYGIVPYSMTVNTGKLLRAKNASWIRDPAPYQQCTKYDKNNNCTTRAAQSVTHSSSWFTNTWGGCIEERKTVTTITASSGYTIPSGATDLDVNSAPTSNADSKWAPYDSDAVTEESGSAGIDKACPKEARHLAAFASDSDVSGWLGTMKAGGFTYHDIGLIWGARLMSSDGLWSSDNPTSYNKFPVNKHLIFMTDGVMDPDVNSYTAYGVEKYDRRVTSDGDATKQYNSHLQRFRMMCNRIKGMNISLWVIAFGTSSGTGLTQEMINCASSPSQAFKADDQQSLINRFTQIGESIGALRLSR